MQKHLKHFLISTTIGLAVLLFFMVLNYLNDEVINLEWVKNGLIFTTSYTYPLYYISAYSFDYIKKLGTRYQMSPWKSVLLGFPIVTILNIVTIITIQYLIQQYIFTDESIDFGENFWDRIKVPLWISLTIGTSFYLLNFIRGYNQAKLNEQVSETTFITQKHEALKTQIGPHFLFNSLNVVSGLIDENPEKAQDFIADLAQVYRYVLDQKDKEWVSLSEEIQFAHTYIDLVQTRFENGLIVQIQDNLTTTDLMIAPLTLQLLLENCIKHNAISKTQPLYIDIYEKANELIIENNLNPKKQLHSTRKGSGLNHIKARYNTINADIDILKTDTSFIVKIPLFTKNLIQMKTEEVYTDQELKDAREEVKERLGFYANLGAYIIICGVLAGINLYHGGYFWAIWPIMGWGIGVLSHGLGVFYFNNKGTSGNRWQERQARKLLEKRKKG